MKTHYPRNTMAAALKAADPMSAQMALEQAEAGLVAIRDECVTYLDDLQAQLECLGATVADVRERLKCAYGLSRKVIGVGYVVGLPQIDSAAQSLCDVADCILQSGNLDWAPVSAHIGVMRLVRQPGMDAGSVDVLLSGLGDLRRKFGCASVPAAR